MPPAALRGVALKSSANFLFNNESRLSFIEVKNLESVGKTKYRYQYMDRKDCLIFRYDNAYHHTEVQTFPHHKHIKAKVIDSEEPELYDILLEIQGILKPK